MIRERRLGCNCVGSRWGENSWPVEEWAPCTELPVGALEVLFEEDSHTLSAFFFKKQKNKKTKHNVLDTERQVYMFRFYREKEIFTATRLPKWLVMRCTANLMPYGVAIVWFLRILLLREMRGEWVRREGGDVMWFYYSRV